MKNDDYIQVEDLAEDERSFNIRDHNYNKFPGSGLEDSKEERPNDTFVSDYKTKNLRSKDSRRVNL